MGTRWKILTLLFLVTVINFIDRQALSVVAPVIRDEFHLSATQYGRIVSSFMIGMLIGEFPMGWAMDRFGVRAGLSFSALWWSIATALHATARSFFQFSVFRLWMGTGECGNYSGGMKVVSEWFPMKERALAIGIFNTGSMVGSMIAPPLVVYLTLHFGWRKAFLVPGILGAFWVILWRWKYRSVEEHPTISPEEREYIRAGRAIEEPSPPNAQLLARRQTWALILCRFMVGPVIQFYWYWMADYLHAARGLTLAAIGMFAWTPFLFGDVGSVAGGWVAGLFMRRGTGLARTRLGTMFFGAALCMLSLLVARSASAPVAIAGICVVVFGHTFLSANMFASITDMFPSPAVGRVTSFTGIAGATSGLIFPILTGMLIDRFSYAPVLTIVAFMPLAGVIALALLARGFQRVDVA